MTTGVAQSSVQMAFCDLPYGVLNANWDVRIDLPAFWRGLSHVRDGTCATAMTATQPFTTELINSNRTNFSYDLVWIKNRGTGAFHAKRRQIRAHESILLFYAKGSTYNPLKVPAKRSRRGTINKHAYETSAFGAIAASQYVYGDTVYPLSWFSCQPDHARHKNHSSQKPLTLIDWLIRTYSNSGDTVLDPVSGSFTTAVAACLSGRNSIGIEKDASYFEAGVERVRKTVADNKLDVSVEVQR